jgi:hypothetical protein
MKVLVFSLDEKTHHHVTHFASRLNASQPIVASYYLQSKVEITGVSSTWRQPQFNLMSILKIEGALQVIFHQHDKLSNIDYDDDTGYRRFSS